MILVRLKQVLVLLVGLAAAAVMVVLGLWQLDVYHSQGARAAQARAAEPPVLLTEVAPAAAPVGDAYGRSVRFTGRYDPGAQVLVPIPERPGSFRVLTALRQDDGSVVPVVRGITDGVAAAPAPVTSVSQTGVLLPSEPEQLGGYPEGQVGSVRLPALAQQWPGPLVAGFVTLSAEDAAAQGLTPAVVNLPEAEGRLRNGAYALQWWVFAAFAIAMSLRMARDFATLEDLALDRDSPAGSPQNST